MKTPHVHAELIKAWADGAEIETRWSDAQAWIPVKNPDWCNGFEYRIKPEPKPDVVLRGWIEGTGEVSQFNKTVCIRDNLKLTFDGETGELKSAEVL